MRIESGSKLLLASLAVVLLFCCSRPDSDQPSLVAQALPAYLKAVEIGMPGPGSSTLQIRDAMARGDWGSARQLSKVAIDADPDSGAAAFTRGVVLNMCSSFGGARTAFEQALENGPSFAGSERVFYFYGVCLTRLGEGELARESLLAQLRIDPDNGDTNSALGDLALQEGDPEAALSLYRLAIEQMEIAGQAGVPTELPRASAYLGIGDALIQQGHVKEAMQALQESVALDSNDARTWYKLSRIYLQLGNKEEAGQALAQYGRLRSGR